MGKTRRAWRYMAAAAGALMVLGAGAFLMVVSGVYNIAASRPHFHITYQLLDFAKRRAVETQSFAITAPLSLDDPDLVKLGAAHYLGGCALCHASPGMPRNPVVANMQPKPANLVNTAPSWSPAQLFWIVKHGLKYTGMPAWPDQQRDDEVWAMVAFLRVMPSMSYERYTALSTGGLKPASRTGREIAEYGAESEALSRCARCHGAATPEAANSLVPTLAGQSRAYLERAMLDYAEEKRQSGIMRPVIAELDDASMRLLAQYYAELPRRQGDDVADEAKIARGREIATRGDPAAGVPACLACHGGRSAPSFPTLDGQNTRYLAAQLRLWKSGGRKGSVQGQIMAVIAPRLNDAQIDDVTAYFASVEAPRPPAPAPSPAAPKPRAPRRAR